MCRSSVRRTGMSRYAHAVVPNAPREENRAIPKYSTSSPMRHHPTGRRHPAGAEQRMGRAECPLHNTGNDCPLSDDPLVTLRHIASWSGLCRRIGDHAVRYMIDSGVVRLKASAYLASAATYSLYNLGRALSDGVRVR
jgi:hypothetical protein